MKIKQHKGSGLQVREDGAILMPPANNKFPQFRWTFGYKRPDGYCRVRHNGKVYLVHRLVAETFLPNPLDLPTVDHIDRNPSNNAVSNLRWASYKAQQDNKQCVEDSLERYGVRQCEDKNAYYRAYQRAYGAKQKSLGKRQRRCPNGEYHWLTDEEFNKLKEGST